MTEFGESPSRIKASESDSETLVSKDGEQKHDGQLPSQKRKKERTRNETPRTHLSTEPSPPSHRTRARRPVSSGRLKPY